MGASNTTAGWLRFALTLALGTAGGWVFHRLALPLPWMLGAMTFVTVAVLLRAPMQAPPTMRPPLVAVIGVMLGASFTPALVGQLPGWGATLAGLVAFTAISGAACWLFLWKVAGYDRVTAYFAGMPGGLNEMIEVGAQKGGDEMIIALTHASRIFLVVFSLPFLLQLGYGIELGGRATPGVHLWEAPVSTWAWLAGCAVVGVGVGALLRLPAHQLTGPMFVSALFHVTGLTDFTPPIEIVQAAQIGLGAVLACRFRAATPGRVLRVLGLSAGMTVILLLATVAAAGAVAALTGHDFVTLLLAYSPGGLAEMSLVALALNAEVALIAAHHLVRILIVMLGAAPVFALIDRMRAR